MFLLRLIPFLGPLSILFGFGKRVLALKQEKIAHAAVGQAFPVANQIEIDNHSVRIQMAAWRLAAGLGAVGAAFCGVQWFLNDQWKDSYHAQADDSEAKYKVASAERMKYYNSYVKAETEIADLRIRVSDASIKRQGLIAIETKQKGVIRRKKIEAERKMAPSEPIDPSAILRVESVSGGGIAGAGDISDATGLQTGAGASPNS